MRTTVEIERAFAPRPDTPVPPLTALGAVARAEPAGEARLDATYYDTPGGVLLRAGVTLRRRAGGADEGWHLKLPVSRAGAREEVHVALAGSERDADPVPAELLDLVSGWTRGIAVAPVARIRTRRTTTRLLAADGVVLAELADDLVEGRAAALDAQPTYWREWELELVSGDSGLLDEAEALFATVDVGPSPVQRKVAVVLGSPHRPEDDLPRPRPRRPARLAVHARIARQVRTLETLDPAVRQGRADGVHGLRKACRRLRAVLAAYRPLLEREHTDPVREELRWLARSLGEARDEAVVLERLEQALIGQPADVVVGPVHEQLQQRGERTDRTDELREVLDSERYRALRGALDALVAAPPWTALAEEPARKVLPRLVHREGRRLASERRRAEDPHEVRKAAKRLRYAYEVVEPLWPEARRPRRAVKRLTEVLGDRQDGIVARGLLLELATEAAENGENAFTWGRLHALEEQLEPQLVTEAEQVWRRVRKLSW